MEEGSGTGEPFGGQEAWLEGFLEEATLALQL